MKFAVDIRSLTSPTPSGVGHYVRAMLTALCNTNIELVLFCTGRRPPVLPEAITTAPNVTVIHRRIPNKFVNLGIVLGMVRLEHLVREPVDAVWYPNIGFLPKTTLPTLLTVHDLAFHFLPDTYTTWDHWWARATRALHWIRSADQVIAVSQSTAEDIARLRKTGNVTVIPHGIDHERFSATVQPTDRTRLQQLGVKTPYLLSLATQEPRKNIASLVEAFDTLVARGYQGRLVLAGGAGWKRNDLDRALHNSPNPKRIINLGYITDADRPILLRHTEALCLPSRYEGFGMQVLEAMACGAPIITSRNSSLHELTDNAALLVRAMNVTELTEALWQLVNDAGLRKDLSQRGISRAKQFDWNKTASALMARVKENDLS